MFNHEPQWYLIDLFENAQRRVVSALHDGASYNKEGYGRGLLFAQVPLLARTHRRCDRWGGSGPRSRGKLSMAGLH